MYTLKVIARDGVPAALQKAERYRLLRESEAAESICLDVLAVDPANQAATVWAVSPPWCSWALARRSQIIPA